MPKGEKAPKERLDALLVARGLSPDAEQARRLIWSGSVLVDGDLVDQPATLVPETAEIRLRAARRRYVTRGGEKLDGALARFGVDVAGRYALDVGAAGGGFTDCLLSHGAARVYAVEVGRGQLAQRLRLDPRVVDLGGTDITALGPSDLDPPPTLAVVDVTFVSLSDVLPHVLRLLTGRREVIALVKPLQEAAALGLGRPPDLQRTVLTRLLAQLESGGIPVCALAPSDPAGPGGALEFFVHIGEPGLAREALTTAIDEALAEGAALLTRRTKPGRSGQQRRRNWRTFRRRRGG